MTLQEAAQYLNRQVMFYDKVHRIGGKYLLTAVIVRRLDAGVILQAELTDLGNSNAVLIAGMENILPVCTEGG